MSFDVHHTFSTDGLTGNQTPMPPAVLVSDSAHCVTVTAVSSEFVLHAEVTDPQHILLLFL